MRKFLYAVLIVLLIAILVVFVLTTGYGMPDNALRRAMLPEFEERRAQWEAAGISHYRITAKTYGAMNSPLLCLPADLEIRDGEVIDIGSAAYDPAFEADSVNCENEPMFREQYANLTIERVFETAEHYLNEETSMGSTIFVDLEYDETYGFPVLVRVSSQSIAHLPTVRITHFEILTD